MKRRAIVIFLIVVGALMAGYGTAYVASEDVRYITRAGFEQPRFFRPAPHLVTGRSQD
jgi:hypothetical protein